MRLLGQGLGGDEGLQGRSSSIAADAGLGKLIKSSESALIVDVGLPEPEPDSRKEVMNSKFIVKWGFES